MSTLGEISTIRDILMGEYIQEYEKRFEELQKDMEQKFLDLQESLSSMEARSAAQHQQLQQTFAEQLQALGNTLGLKLGQLDEKVETMSREDKHNLGVLLQNLAAHLVQQS